MSHPGKQMDAEDAFRLDVRQLVNWHRGAGGDWVRCADREIRRIVRDGYLRATDLTPPYRLRGHDGVTGTSRAAHVFCRTFWGHRLDPRDFYTQERYWEVILRSLDEAIDGPTCGAHPDRMP